VSKIGGLVKFEFPLSRLSLVRVRARALRCGVWFSVLSRTERACVDLVVRVVERVRSGFLQRILFSVVEKLEAALESPVHRLMREVSIALAIKLSRVAQKWGNESAVRWVKDSGFLQYLAVMHINAES
jgi:hypothetical protein